MPEDDVKREGERKKGRNSLTISAQQIYILCKKLMFMLGGCGYGERSHTSTPAPETIQQLFQHIMTNSNLEFITSSSPPPSEQRMREFITTLPSEPITAGDLVDYYNSFFHRHSTVRLLLSSREIVRAIRSNLIVKKRQKNPAGRMINVYQKNI